MDLTLGFEFLILHGPQITLAISFVVGERLDVEVGK